MRIVVDGLWTSLQTPFIVALRIQQISCRSKKYQGRIPGRPIM